MDIKKSLGITEAQEFRSSFNRPNLYYEVRQKTNDIDRQIIKFVKQHSGKSGIVYCISRKKVEDLAAVLKANDIKPDSTLPHARRPRTTSSWSASTSSWLP